VDAAGTARLLALGAVLLQAGAAQAEESSWYMGISYGAATTHIDESVVAVAGATASSVWRDERDPGVKVLLGYAFNRHLAVEGGYAQLGDFSISRDVTAPAAGAAHAELEVKGWVIDLVGTAALDHGFSAIGKAGALLSEVRTFRTVSGAATLAPGLTAASISDELHFKVGAGLEYALQPKVVVRVEWERFYRVGDPARTGEMDITLVSGGMRLLF
jgi:OOP family OmpA-OmpF porin